MPRYNFTVGFELYDASTRLQYPIKTNPRPFHKESGMDEKKFNDLLDRFLALHHLQGEIVKLIHYSNIIASLCKKIGIKFAFINGLCPWDNHFFEKIDLKQYTPNDLTLFTQQSIINIKSRTHDKICKLYDLQHAEYQRVGGVDPRQWVNLYNSFGKNCIDRNFDKIHPGSDSNNIYFNLIKNHIQNQSTLNTYQTPCQITDKFK